MIARLVIRNGRCVHHTSHFGITYRDVLKVLPFGNTIALVEMSGEQLQANVLMLMHLLNGLFVFWLARALVRAVDREAGDDAGRRAIHRGNCSRVIAVRLSSAA